MPVQRGWLADGNEATGYLAGVWDCTAFVDVPGGYGGDEFMLLLEGTVEMRLPDGGSVAVGPGEAFVIPKGFECQWSQPGYVRKVFMIVDDPVPAPENASLTRITKPDLTGAPLDGAVETARTVFENATGHMSVSVRSHSGGRSAAAPTTAHELLHVLDGALTLTAGGEQTRLGPGKTAYLRAGTPVARAHAPGTRILEARYRP